MLPPLGRNVLCCSLRYGFDISSFLSSLRSSGKVCWRYLSNVSTSLQAEVGVIKDMVMLREDKQQCLFTIDEIETVITVSLFALSSLAYLFYFYWIYYGLSYSIMAGRIVTMRKRGSAA